METINRKRMLSSQKTFTSKALYYFVPLSGRVCQSTFHFFLGLTLIKVLNAEGFGVFAFVQVIAFLITNVTDAMMGIPLSVYRPLAKTDAEKRAYDHLFASGNLIITGLGASIGFLILLTWLGEFYIAVFGALYIFTFSSNEFGRMIAFAHRKAWIATRANLIYVGVAIAALAYMKWYEPEFEVTTVFFCLSLANLVALAFLLPGQFQLRFLSRWKTYINEYVKIWKESSAWNLIGVLASEIISNAHSYIIALVAGPQALAPIAAAFVLYRPLYVIMGALIQLERPKLSEQILLNKKSEAHQTRILFLGLSILTWGLINIIVFGFWNQLFKYMFEGKYQENQIFWIMIFWSAIFLIRCINALLKLDFQSRKKFQPLAMAAVYACPVSVIAAGVLFFTKGVSASLLGIFLGDAVLLSLLLSLFFNVREPKPC